jgi:hypothetical protein
VSSPDFDTTASAVARAGLPMGLPADPALTIPGSLVVGVRSDDHRLDRLPKGYTTTPSGPRNTIVSPPEDP